MNKLAYNEKLKIQFRSQNNQKIEENQQGV